jgi:hypothetical protein
MMGPRRRSGHGKDDGSRAGTCLVEGGKTSSSPSSARAPSGLGGRVRKRDGCVAGGGSRMGWDGTTFCWLKSSTQDARC